jgi:hypothetical protein
MTKHTPGPWEIKEKEQGRRQVIVTKQGVISELANYGHAGGINATCFIDELKANACLIASAPDLLDACRAIASLADGQGQRNMMEVAGQAKAAIAKAMGRD